MTNYDFTLELLNKTLADKGDEIISSGITVPEWMLVGFDTLQEHIGAVTELYADIQVTEGTTEQMNEVEERFENLLYSFVASLWDFEAAVDKYLKR